VPVPIISFSSSSTDAGEHDSAHDWVAAGWHFREVLHEAILKYPDDAELVGTLELAIRVKYLFVGDLELGLAARVTQAIRQVASESKEPIEGEDVDEQLKMRHKDSMLKLLKASGLSCG
jgi:hypothetical protein